MTHDEARRIIEQQFVEGSLPAEQTRALHVHLRECDACRAFYDRSADAEAALEGSNGASRAEVERVLARGRPAEVLRPRRPWRAAVITGVTALAAGLALFVFAPPKDLATRGGDGTGKRSWVRVFVRAETAVRPLDRTMRSGDGLLFAYTNLKESDARWMAIAGLDASGRLHWYHPAFVRAEDEPRALAIEAGVADRELTEVVYGEHAIGSLELCALFSDAPLEIRTLDAEIEQRRAWPSKIDRDCRTVEVTP